jgi:hypothetical protein
MTVAELIKELQKFDSGLEVFRQDYEHSPMEVGGVDLQTLEPDWFTQN